jgi:hypothetical protein
MCGAAAAGLLRLLAAAASLQGVAARGSSCAAVGEALGYGPCSPNSCVGVQASCIGDYAVSCSCGDNPVGWQAGHCSDPGGAGCAAEAARWCDATAGCHAFAINGAGYQGFPITCSPYGGLGGTITSPGRYKSHSGNTSLYMSLVSLHIEYTGPEGGVIIILPSTARHDARAVRVDA